MLSCMTWLLSHASSPFDADSSRLKCDVICFDERASARESILVCQCLRHKQLTSLYLLLTILLTQWGDGSAWKHQPTCPFPDPLDACKIHRKSWISTYCPSKPYQTPCPTFQYRGGLSWTPGSPHSSQAWRRQEYPKTFLSSDRQRP